jgi:hypothetical protein
MMDRQIKPLAFAVYAVLCLGGIGHGEPFHRIPEADRAILSRVAQEYRLNAEQRRLLFAIRIVEAGGPGREMGVLVPSAQRFRGDHARSLECQARWAAGTIRRRYTWDLEAFAARWCPLDAENDPKNLNRHWLTNVRAILEKGR